MDGDELIDQISLHDIDHLNRHAFLGIMIGEVEHQGKGYGTEAVRLVLDYGFNTLTRRARRARYEEVIFTFVHDFAIVVLKRLRRRRRF
jgi:RimJ/RimL family protein N-acetyltransferase